MNSKKKSLKKAQNKPRGKAFKNGNKIGVGNGRPKLSEDQKEWRDIEKWRLERIYTEIAHIPARETMNKSKDFDLDTKVKVVAGLFVKAMEGDGLEWERLISRLFGKPRESVKMEVSGKLSLVEVVRRIGDRNSR